MNVREPWLGSALPIRDGAHKFTRANDFSDLSALSRNFFARILALAT
jgi:hypothetical protein